MSGITTIKSNRDFKNVYRHGISFANRSLVLYLLPNRNTGTRFGFSISKKLGKAVVRNCIRRRLKEICRLNRQWFPAGYDLVIIARHGAVDKDYHYLSKHLYGLAEKARRKINGGR
ncbi:ribonuclease P protein component [Desulfotomaculum copahuensis]|uniref:Ribonuclease P protein component n=1 Tax=Desulfotomaculum copahuensis TaxID=1838280 RepID=A0A1B7LBH1_9FIRM|nr:ribonuclease P protein component [Desulfotomaculum copahuensis]OAT79886.1 ribonuclease P protein component [Desulfotomaculum copahuensis]